MFLEELFPYIKLNSLKKDFYKPRKFIDLSVIAWIIGMLFMCIIIMSLMIVKVSSTAAFYQNQTAALRTRSIQSYNPTNEDTTSTIAAPESNYREQQERDFPATNFTQPKLQPLKPPNYKKIPRTDDMRAKIQQQTQQQQHQQHQQQQLLHAGETAYLLERVEDAPQHEQPIYGTWRTKARRPQPPLVAAAASSSSAAAATLAGVGASSAALIMGDVERHDVDSQYQHHLYERLPRRSSTMTPIKSEIYDQMPRPPRLVSRRPSLIVRRQFLETPSMNMSFRDDQKPKPFHFPFDGPMPEEFKKVEGERVEVNNIQDILQQLHLGNGAGGGHGKVPQLVMMPTGLHIAGSFKNLKSSGLSNFFRNKRNKKQMQLTFPIPMPMQLFNSHQLPYSHFGAALDQPYQRIALDQFYPYKPRSPNDINLLAMHQQLKANRSKNKKKKQTKAIASNNLMLQHSSNQRPFAAPDPYLQSYPQLFAMNVTQKPKLKRMPFKVNLDIFPVLPPSKDYKSSAFTLAEAKIPSSSRPATILGNPFSEYYPMGLSPSALAYSAHYDAPLMNAIKFPSSIQPAIQMPQSSNMQITFPDQMSRYIQQQQQQHQQRQQQLQQQQQQQQLQQQQQQQLRQQQQQQQQQFVNPAANPQSSFTPADCIHPSQSSAQAYDPSNPKSSQLMVHLNVFPKQKPSSSMAPPSTNPFYSNVGYINRISIPEESAESLAQIEQRNQSKIHSNSTSSGSHQPQQQHQQQPISRSDTVDLQPLVDFEHPIVAAEIPDLPHSSALVSNKLDSPDYASYYDNIEARNNNNNFNYNLNDSVEQLASEAQTASLFRFPVENLIQFQADDAL